QLRQREPGVVEALEGLGLQRPVLLAVVDLVVERKPGGLQRFEIAPDRPGRDARPLGEVVDGQPARRLEVAQDRPLPDDFGITRHETRVLSLVYFATVTVPVAVEALPEASVQRTVSVWSRPLPKPERSARSSTCCASTTCQSTLEFPSPRPLTGSLLATAIAHTGSPDRTDPGELTPTATHLWFGA